MGPAIASSQPLQLLACMRPMWHAAHLGSRLPAPECASVQEWQAADPDLVACDTCNFCVHDRCDPEARRALAQLRTAGSKGAYNCPSCRRIREARHAIEVGSCAQAQSIHCTGPWLQDGLPMRPLLHLLLSPSTCAAT